MDTTDDTNKAPYLQDEEPIKTIEVEEYYHDELIKKAIELRRIKNELKELILIADSLEHTYLKNKLKSIL